MTGSENISLLVSLGGFIAVIISVWFVFLQTRIFAKQTEIVARSLSTSMSQAINSQVEEITRIFIQYPELRPYFYEGQSIQTSDPQYARAEAVAEFMLDTFFTVAEQAARGVGDRSQRGQGTSWKAYVSDTFAHSPILVQFLQDREAWYSQELVALMRRGLEIRDRDQK